MPKRGGLGQRGINLLISDSPGKTEKTPTDEAVKKEEKTRTGTGRSSSVKKSAGTGSKTRTKGNPVPGTKTEAKKGNKAAAKESTAKAAKSNAKTRTADAGGSGIADAAAAQRKGKTADPEITATEPLQIPIEQIEPNRSQPRKNFDEDTLQELADSIRQFGVIQPLIVQKKEDYYAIIAGERRWRAARIAGLKKLPVIVKEYTPREVMEISLIENIQREDLNPMEEAAAYKNLMDEFHLRQDEVAQRVSRSRAAVANSLRLLNLDQRVQDMVVAEMLTTGHARALLAIPDPDLQYSTAQRVFDEKLSVREVEKLVRRLNEGPKPARKQPVSETLLTVYANMEEEMKASLGTKVSISPKSAQKGKIEIEYYSADDLDRLCALLKMPQSETRG